jgi:hypothetical protein
MIGRQVLLSVLSMFCVAAVSTQAAATPLGSRRLATPPSPPSGPVASGSAGVTAGGGGFNDYGRVHSAGGSEDSGRATGSPYAKPAWVIRTRDCGAPRVGVPAVVNRQNFCNLVRRDCNVVDPKELPTDPHVTTLALLRSRDGGNTWQYYGVTCASRTGQPRVTPLLARQAIERLVPRPGIGVAPPGGKTLVNLQTVLWADTPADRSLGTVTLLGTYRVALRVHAQQVAWAFGDGDTEVADGPGLPYRKGEHCTTVTCPGHFGHIYATTGTMTITEQVTWSGQYSINGGAWEDVAGTVDGPAATTQVTVLEARGVLVADPRPS